MKFNSLFVALLSLGAVAALRAAPLAADTPVHSGPDASAPSIASLKAGTEPTPATGVTAPAGWTAVTVSGTHEVYAANRDVTKSLEVRVGAPYLTEPKNDAPVFATAEKGDKSEIIDYRGKWTKFRLTKSIVGYIKSGSPAKSAAPVVAPATPRAVRDVATQAPEQSTVTAVGKAASVGDGGSSALPRLFQGKFASTYSALRPRRPYAFQLNDDAGARYAYVDVSKLLATEQLNKYLDRTVVVYGTAQAVPGSKDMVVVAESLQLR
jgi:hypothetical protein